MQVMNKEQGSRETNIQYTWVKSFWDIIIVTQQPKGELKAFYIQETRREGVDLSLTQPPTRTNKQNQKTEGQLKSHPHLKFRVLSEHDGI